MLTYFHLFNACIVACLMLEKIKVWNVAIRSGNQTRPFLCTNKSQIMKLDHEEWGRTVVEINHNLAETFT